MFTFDCSTITTEISIAKVYNEKIIHLSWETNCLEEEGKYTIEFDGVEYEVLPKPNYTTWTTPELEENKIYKWRIKEFDGFEYLEYSNYNYVCYKPNRYEEIKSYIEVLTKDIKSGNSQIEAELKINEKTSFLPATINIQKVQRIIPANIFIIPPKDCYIDCELEVKKPIISYIESSIVVKTKEISPPKSPFLVNMEGDFDAVIGTLTPLFSWWKSNDELINQNLYYEIQIDNKPSFYEPIFVKDNIKNPISDQMVYPLPIDLPEGKYYWRIRTYEGEQYSSWVYGNRFVINSITNDIPSEIYVTKNFKLENIYASLNIPVKYILESQINVFSWYNSFLSSHIEVYGKKYLELETELVIFKYKTEQTLETKLEVYNRENLSSFIYVYKRGTKPNDDDCIYSAEENVYCKLTVKPISNCECSAYVISKDEVQRKCSIEVFKLKSIANIPADIYVYKKPNRPYGTTLDCEIIVHKRGYLERIYQEDFSTLYSYIHIYRKPNPIILNSDLQAEISIPYKKEDTLLSEIYVQSKNPQPLNVTLLNESSEWNDYSTYNFSFEPKPGNENLPLGYVMCFDNYQNSEPRLEGYALVDNEPKNVTVYYNNLKTIFSVDMNKYELSGEYYFHVTYFYGEDYLYAPTAHYKVKWNKKPNAPEELKINGLILTEGNRKIARRQPNVFSWKHSFDYNLNDKITYHLQICNNMEFKSSQIELFGYEAENIETTEFKIILSFLKEKRYFWRVRAFDGKQYSDWSMSQSFVLNIVPPIPDNIQFFEKNT